MGKKEQTTVNLSEIAQKIKIELAPLFGLKNILSAGLILFGKLTSDQQKQAIAESNGVEPTPLTDEDYDEMIRQLARDFATLTEKLEDRASANAQKKPRRKSG